ncbi:MAG: ABC transporter substrate-binding protein [Gammaproteobacteria bacterium]|nr:ABC transporter substrate-binding protein [Gammaproteobacteria bacterium]
MTLNISKLSLTGTLVLIASLLLTACSETPRDPLRLASSPWPGYEPLYLARDLGYLGEDRVRLFELPSSDITMESFRNNSTDLATLTLDETLELIHDGTAMRILLILDISNGGDAVLAKPGIKDVQDIKGKRISIVNIPLGIYMLSRLLDSAGLERSDVEVFPMPESKQLAFYEKGKADVVITFEPVKTKLLEKGAHVIFDSSDIPNEIFDLLVVHEDVYQRRRDEICHVVNQWYRTLDYMQQNPEQAADAISKRLGVTPQDFIEMLDGIKLPSRKENINMLGTTSPGILEPAKKLNDIMVHEKQLMRHVDISSTLDMSFAECHEG